MWEQITDIDKIEPFRSEIQIFKIRFRNNFLYCEHTIFHRLKEIIIITIMIIS